MKVEPRRIDSISCYILEKKRHHRIAKDQSNKSAGTFSWIKQISDKLFVAELSILLCSMFTAANALN